MGFLSGLFGGGKPTVSSTSVSGYGALPPELQQYFKNLAASGQAVLDNPDQYFAPMGLTAEEEMARGLINPNNLSSNIDLYMNPYRDILMQDISQSFQDDFGALSARANEAGAFGSSGYRGGQADLEQERLDSIARASGNQYNTAFDQMGANIAQLMGFGSLERGVDLAQRQALPSALGFQGGLINPLLSGSNATQYTPSTDTGILGMLGKLGTTFSSVSDAFGGFQPTAGGGSFSSESGFGGDSFLKGSDGKFNVDDFARLAAQAGQVFSSFSDSRLKKNVEKIGKHKGLNVYKFDYLWGGTYVGYMAQEVEKIYPHAVGEVMGYKTVNYGLI